MDILKHFEKPKSNESTQILEKIKTLNYNISIAFNRLDQLLKQIEQKLPENVEKSNN